MKPRRPSPKTPSASSRNATVDCLRIVAALGIVWFHTQAPGNRIAYLALPFFLVLLGMPSSGSVAQRALRLLRPFVVWSLIYGAMLTALALRNGAAPLSWWRPEMLLAGTSIHLWFLPFAFLGGLAFRLIRSDLLIMALPVVAAAAVVLLPPITAEPFAQWMFGIVPLTIGVCLFRCGLRVAWPWALASLILFLGRQSPDNLTIAFGTALSILLIQIPLPRMALAEAGARLSFMVFLCHMLVLQAGWTLGLSGLTLGIFSVIGAIALAVVLDRLRNRAPFRWLT